MTIPGERIHESDAHAALQFALSATAETAIIAALTCHSRVRRTHRRSGGSRSSLLPNQFQLLLIRPSGGKNFTRPQIVQQRFLADGAGRLGRDQCLNFDGDRVPSRFGAATSALQLKANKSLHSTPR